MHIRSCLREAPAFAIAALFATVAFTCSAALAQQPAQPSWLDRPAQLKVEHASFAEVTGILTRQLGHSIIADGTPLLRQTDLTLKGTAREVLDAVADRFDYTWTVSKAGVILMNKRFDDPNEMPQINLTEVRQMARDTVRILAPFADRPGAQDFGAALRSLYLSFTPEQRAFLESGHRIIVRDLFAPQRSLVTNAIYDVTFGQPLIVLWRPLASKLQGLDDAILLVMPMHQETTGAIADGQSESPKPTIGQLILEWSDTGVRTRRMLVNVNGLIQMKKVTK